METLGRTLVVAGLGVAALGVVAWLLGKALPGLRPGRLPGDIVVERPGFSLYAPVVTMLVVSLLVSGVFWLLGALRK